MAINLAPRDTTWKTSFSKGFYTQRLCVSVFEKEKTTELENLLNNSLVYRFIADLSDKKEAKSWFSDVFGKRNYLFLSVKTKENSELIGFLSIHRHRNQPVMIGGSIDPCNWNKGYASELLQGLVSFLKSSSFREPLFAEAHRDNLFVHKTLDKAGFLPGKKPSDKPDHILFSITISADI